MLQFEKNARLPGQFCRCTVWFARCIVFSLDSCGCRPFWQINMLGTVVIGHFCFSFSIKQLTEVNKTVFDNVKVGWRWSRQAEEAVVSNLSNSVRSIHLSRFSKHHVVSTSLALEMLMFCCMVKMIMQQSSSIGIHPQPTGSVILLDILLKYVCRVL